MTPPGARRGAVRPPATVGRRYGQAPPTLRPHAAARPGSAEDDQPPEDPRRTCATIVARAARSSSEQDWGMRAHGVRDPPPGARRSTTSCSSTARASCCEPQRTLRITDGVVRFRIIKLAPGTPPPPEPARGRPPGRRDGRRRPQSPRARVRRALRASTLQRTERTFRPECAAPSRAPALDSPADTERPTSFAPERSTADGRHEHQPGHHHREPHRRSRAALAAQRHVRLQAARRRATRAARTAPRGEWVDKPNYFDVTVWGAQGENCARYLAKGRRVAIDGRLEWREWEDQDGNKRQAVDIIADTVQFLGGRDDAGGGGGGARLHAALRRPRRHERLRRGAGRAAAQPVRASGRRHPVLGRSGLRPPRTEQTARLGGPSSSPGAARPRSPYRGARTELSHWPGRAPSGARFALPDDRTAARNLHVAKQRNPQADPPAGQEGRPRQRPAQALPVLQGQDRAGRLQGHRRRCAGSSPSAARSARGGSPAPAAGTRASRDRRQARARARAAARTPPSRATSATAAAAAGARPRPRDR